MTHPAEQVPVEHLHARLAQLGAKYYPNRSNARRHIYWMPSTRLWLKVVRVGQTATISYHATCPCSGG